MPRKLVISNSTKNRIVSLHAQGLSFRRIAGDVQLSLGTVMRRYHATLAPVAPNTPAFELRPAKADHLATEAYWRQRVPAEQKRRACLTIGGHGVAIRVHHGELIVFQQGREQRFLPGTHGFKSAIVETRGASLTTDAIAWLHRQNIGLFILCDGEPVSVVSGCALTHVPLRRQQYALAENPLPIAKRIVTQKIAGGLATNVLSPRDAHRFQAEARHAPSMTSLLMVEARAASTYFDNLNITLRHKPKLWPPAWTDWRSRLSPISGSSPRHAVHPVNAMLNYAYTVAAAQLTRALTAHGLDVACGFLHTPSQGRASLAYDALELARADIDSRIANLCNSRAWSRADFTVTKSGIVRLTPYLARIVAMRAMLTQPDLAAIAVWFQDAITQPQHDRQATDRAREAVLS